MTLRLHRLPVDLVAQIMRKMEIVTLCRFRQTTTFMNQLAETPFSIPKREEEAPFVEIDDEDTKAQLEHDLAVSKLEEVECCPSTRVHLMKLPTDMLLQVFRRMNSKALCRLRQTCQRMDSFAEEYRFRITSKREDSPWILNIKICDGEGYREPYKLEYRIYRKMEAKFSEIRSPTEYCRDYDFLDDPFIQLSAVSLRAVEIMDFRELTDSTRTMILDKRIPPLLKSLRLDLDWLILSCKYTPELFSSVKYSRLRLDNLDVPLKQFVSEIGIQTNCIELMDERCKDLTFCTTLFRQMEKITLIISEGYGINNTYNFVVDVLTTLKSDAVSIGKLKHLKIISLLKRDFAIKLDIQGMTEIYKFVDEKGYRTDSLHFYKLPFENGVVIIVEGVQQNIMYELFFVKNASRSELFDICSKYFHTKMVSKTIMTGFFGASSDAEAIDFLQKKTAPLISYRWNDDWNPVLKK